MKLPEVDRVSGSALLKEKRKKTAVEVLHSFSDGDLIHYVVERILILAYRYTLTLRVYLF